MRFIESDGDEVLANVRLGRLRRIARFTLDSRRFRSSSEIGGSVNVIEVSSKAIIDKSDFEMPGIRAESMQPVGRLPYGLVVAL